MDHWQAPNLTAELKTLAEQRLGQWLSTLEKSQPSEKIENLTSEQREFAEYFLLVNDFAYQWVLKKPQWLNVWLKNVSDSKVDFEQALQHLTAESDLNSVSEFEIKQWLRLQQHFWINQLAFLDLNNQYTVQQITYWQSILANKLIAIALEWLEQQFILQYGEPQNSQGQRQQLLILAMGKLGGMELNYSSDIDLIFCYPEDGKTVTTDLQGTNRPLENSKYFTRFGQRLVALLSENTADGFVYRVDMRLRPYGQSGALSLSFDAMADYYLEQGREWERFAMIKANVIALNDTNNKALLEIIRPFSFRRYIDFSVLDAIRLLKQKITSEMRDRDLARDIKLGQGGIRELEFIVQSLQLISGGRYPQLQTRNWWQSLQVLTDKDLVSKEENLELSAAYEFLRRLENRLQIRNNQQTQQLPEKGSEQVLLALMMGCGDWQELSQQIEKHRNFVEQFFKQLFHDPDEQVPTSNGLESLKTFYFANDLSASDKKTLENLGVSPALMTKLQNFRANFVEVKLGPRGRRRLNQLVPYILLESVKKTNSEQTLERCLALLTAIGRRSAYFEMLAENIPLLEHLVELVSRSSWLAEQLALYPSLLDELLFPSNFGKSLSRADFASQLQQALLRIEPDQIEEQLLAIGRFKHASQFKVAAGQLNRRFSIEQVTGQLSDIAELILEALLHIAWQEMCQKYGSPIASDGNNVQNFAIVGYGKLGGRELGYGSDLDLVFLYKDKHQKKNKEVSKGASNPVTSGKKPIEIGQFYTRLAQRLVHYLNSRTQLGILYEVDTRLRPSGRSGLLVSEFESFADYQRDKAWTWERQALSRARAVAGSENMLEEFSQLRPALLSKPSPDLAQDLVKMREKMRQNLDRSDSKHWDLKHGQGGLVDIEFLVQYWTLLSAQEGLSSSVQGNYSNQEWLRWLARKQIISAEVENFLSETYNQFQTISNALKLQNRKAMLTAYELVAERQKIIEIWYSTFPSSELQ